MSKKMALMEIPTENPQETRFCIGKGNDFYITGLTIDELQDLYRLLHRHCCSDESRHSLVDITEIGVYPGLIDPTRVSLKVNSNDRLVVESFNLRELTILEERIRDVRRRKYKDIPHQEKFFRIWERKGWEKAKEFAKAKELVNLKEGGKR